MARALLPKTTRTFFTVVALLGLMVSFRASSQDNTRFTLQASSRFLSPNDDGISDSIILNGIPLLNADEPLADWFVVVFDAAGNTVRTFRADKRLIKPDSAILSGDPLDVEPLRLFADLEWDGRDADGRTVEDGIYTIVARVIPAIGPVQESWPLRVIVDTVSPAVSVKAKKACYFREHPLAVDDEAFNVEQKVTAGRGVRYVGTIRSIETGDVVEEKSWTDDAPVLIKWNAKIKDGSPAPAGYYVYELMARDLAGNESYAESTPIAITTQPCVLDVIPEFLTFSPNGDGVRDRVRMGVRYFLPGGTAATLQELKKRPEVRGWSVQILSPDKKTPARTFTGPGAMPDTFEFDGRDERGRALADGLYYIRFSASLTAGLALGQPLPLRLDNTPPALKASTTPVLFEPDPGQPEPLTFRLAADDISRIELWTLQLRLPVPGSNTARLFRKWSGRSVPSDIAWSGRGDGLLESESLEDFEYEFTTYDRAGNRNSRTGTFSTGILFRAPRPGEPDLTARLPDHGYFDKKTNRLTPAGESALDRIKKKLERYGRYRVHVQSHAAIPGVEEQNLLTTEERAWHAFRYLKVSGIVPKSLLYRGMGETEPLISDTDGFANYRNERIEVRLTVK